MKNMILALVAAAILCVQPPAKAGVANVAGELALNVCGLGCCIAASIGVSNWYSWNHNDTLIPKKILALLIEESKEGAAASMLYKNANNVFNPEFIQKIFSSFTPKECAQQLLHLSTQVALAGFFSHYFDTLKEEDLFKLALKESVLVEELLYNLLRTVRNDSIKYGTTTGIGAFLTYKVYRAYQAYKASQVLPIANK